MYDPVNAAIGAHPHTTVSVGPFIALILAVIVTGAGYSMWIHSQNSNTD